ncbi:MAG: MBL fold metallo-hydrolase, partial [Firmicutes bacterium]|nr:MBL fold metallo-hydrolase [Bacillota bacterium]
VSLREIERVVITHCHPDHCGLAAFIRETAGAEIFVNSLEAGHLTGERDYFREILPSLVESGVPQDILQDVARDVKTGEHRKVAREEILPLTGEEVLSFKDGELIVQNFPGHSQGHICLYDPGAKNFFSGDFLLPHITSNPLMEICKETGKRLPAKKVYLERLAHVLKMDIAEVWPGHGENVTNWQETVNNIFRHHLQRNEAVYSLLNEKGRTAYEIAVTMFPQIRGADVVLGVSEVLASLDILLEEGRVSTEEGNEVIMYYKAG